MMRWFAPAWCLLVATGCSVASVAEQPSSVPQNQCQSDSNCPAGSCREGICVTTKGAFDTVLFAVSPSADTTSLVGAQSLKQIDGLLNQSGPISLSIGAAVSIPGKILAPDGCKPSFVDGPKVLATTSDGTIPSLITLKPSAGTLGLFVSPILVPAALQDSSTWVFKLNVPPGTYDVYIQPPDQPDATCPVPPQLLRAQQFPNKAGTLDVSLPVPQLFEVHVSWPLADGGLDGWSVDMLDSVSAKVISNRLVLRANAKGDEYVADLSYQPVQGDATQADQLIRITPPAGVTAPTILRARSGLALFSANSGTVNQLTSLPTPVTVKGQITVMETPTPATAAVTLVATKLEGIDAGVIASFVATPQVMPDGSFSVDVLPGTYHVTAQPIGGVSAQGTGLAAATTEWSVGATPSTQAGRVIELGSILAINGVAQDASGTVAMAGAPVQAVPSPTSIVVDVLKQAIGEPTYVPRGNVGTVQEKGDFAVYVDAGTYDFSIRPSAGSGYAWLVMPGAKISASTGFDLLNLPLPVAYSGTLFTPGLTANAKAQPLAGALIDAYIYLKNGAYTSSAADADSVLQIAETRSDAGGGFRVLIPASLNAVPHM